MGPRLQVVDSGLCPDCPATRQHVFGELVGDSKQSCTFECRTLEARQPIPARWFEHYPMALVRRGVLIRQRVDSTGRASAIDAAGPGCLTPLAKGAWGTSAPAGYAATRVLLCLCPAEVLDRTLEQGNDGTATDMIRMQAEAMERIERITDARARSTVEARVAALLCTLADTLSPPQRRSRIPSDLQQRDLAALLGVRHETVCRVLGKLEKRGAIERDPDGLRILDRPALDAC